MFDKKEVEFKIKFCLRLIRQFDWLLDSYIVDFFVDDHWGKLPASWSRTLSVVDPPELAAIIEGSAPTRVLPLSLLALLKAAKMVSLPRHGRTTHCHSAEIFSEQNITEDKRKSVNNLLWKRIKMKKRHEICLLSDLIDRTSEGTGCRSVVDIGSGLGHLSRTLSFKHRLKTVGVEAQTSLTKQAETIDAQLKYTLAKYSIDSKILEDLKTRHINMFLTPETKPLFLAELKSIKHQTTGLVGLHTCGDLGPLLVQMFSENDDIKFICAVGCCYMKLSCENNSHSYPMSHFTHQIENNILSRESRELACHANETYCLRLKQGAYEDLQIHCYRATLEKLLLSKWPHMKRVALKSVKHYNTLTFERYCKLALEKYDEVDLKEIDMNDGDIVGCLGIWKRVVTYYTLRLILAPVVETVILLDRLLYLMENGIRCDLVPLFNPLVSPRNHVLVAQKGLIKNGSKYT